ncbi:hypothetical protein MY11210_008472 [Beauveria gryllotalpidicola]
MKITIICLALIGLTNVDATLVGRQIKPVPPSDRPETQMLDAARRGIERWGLNGDLQPPTSPKPPLREMPFGLGLPKPVPKYDPNKKTGVTRVPGEPLGPAKKCRPCKRKRQLGCCPSLGKPTKPSKPSKPSSSKSSFPRGKTRRVTAASAKVAAISVLAPYARDVYEEIKTWPVLGYLLQGFDDAVKSLQVAIGGSGRDDIEGNDSKAGLICWLKGGEADETIAGRPNNICTPWDQRFDKDFDELLEKGKLDEKVELCQGYETHQNPYKAVEDWFKDNCRALFASSAYSKWTLQKWSNGLDKILEFCYSVHDYEPAEDDLRRKIEKDCTAFQAKVDEIEGKAAKKKVKKPAVGVGPPTFKSDGCTCNASKLQPFNTRCGRYCRLIYRIGYYASV